MSAAGAVIAKSRLAEVGLVKSLRLAGASLILSCTMAASWRQKGALNDPKPLSYVAFGQVPAGDKALWAAQDSAFDALPSALSRAFCGVQEQFFEASKARLPPCSHAVWTPSNQLFRVL